MLNIQESNPVNMLRQFAEHYRAIFEEDFGAANLKLDNEKGRGHISLFKPFAGVTAWAYSIRFEQDLKFNLNFSSNKLLYLGIVVNGYQLHKYSKEKTYHKIHQSQNFILVGEEGESAEFVIPKGIDFKCCYVILEPSKLEISGNNNSTSLQSDLKSVFSPFLNKDKSFRFFGGISGRISEVATTLIDNKRTDVVGRLLAEGALMNMLAFQIEAHDREKNTDDLSPKLSKAELSRITDLGDLIRKNISRRPSIEELANMIGVSQSKLQIGVKYLHGRTVNQFVTNIRLEVARELIQNTDMNQSEICYHIGFSSRSHFTKIFEERFGKVPSEYKKAFIRNKQGS